jgi:hypothetical protein
MKYLKREMVSMMVEQEFIQVAVPARHVIAVYEFLAELERESAGGIEPSEADDAVAWDAGNLARLARTELSNARTVSGILDVLCQEPGKQYDMQDLVAALPMDYNTLRGNLAAFTRHLKKHYGGSSWPMQVEWRGDEALYSIRPETAAIWKSVRS